MRIDFRPMLAASKPRDFTDQMFYDRIDFPVIATPKIDGIRCVTRDLPMPPEYLSEPVCRSLKAVPNEWIHYQIGTKCIPDLDGEIITCNSDLFEGDSPKQFNSIQSDVMSFCGQPNFRYLLFDAFITSGLPYRDRIRQLKLLFDNKKLPSFCTYVQETLCESLDDLLKFEQQCVEDGFEGVCFRNPLSPYKYGRSTLREGWLVKMKRFVTEEAVIIGVYEEMANNNPTAINDLGYAERSSHSANKSGKNRLGGLHVRMGDVEFSIGSGFTANQRENMWLAQAALIGKKVTFKHMPHGAKDRPRLPIFIGIRDDRDL